MLEGLIKLTRRHFGRLGNLVTGKTHPVTVKTRYRAHLLEVEDVNFHHDSAVFLPDYDDKAPAPGSPAQDKIRGLAVIKACYEQAERCPEQSALVVGHTDRSGSEAYNQSLSELRAENVRAALEGNSVRWVEICEEKHKVEDYQQILQWVHRHLGWPCDPGKKDNVHGSKTTTAVRAFQERYNVEFSKSIPETGTVETETWAAFFDVYMSDLRQLLNVDQKGLEAMRSRLHFLSCGSIGCGERYPITADRKEHYRSPIDRRVEILFFDPGEEPLLDCTKSSGACRELYAKKMYTFARIDGTLERTRFFAKLTFLGSDFVPKADRYRCTYDLVDGSNAAVAAGAELSADAYRVLLHDNHALRDAEEDLLGDDGDATSKPESYTNNDWVRDIRPAVGLRVEIRQERGGAQTKVPANRFFLRWEIEDVEEETRWLDESMKPARLKKFTETFVSKFRRDSAAKEDDNCSTTFGGGRPPAAKTPSPTVLFQTPFDPALPKPLEAVGPLGAKAPVTPVEVGGNSVGQVDVVFFPPPVGGDNYRFRLTLTDDFGNRIPIEEHGDPWITGTFTVWRKIIIDLLVTTDNVNVNYINWDMVRKAYRAGFVEVEGPRTTKKFTQAQWKSLVKSYFINVVGHDPAEVNDDSRYNYSRFFLPDLTGADADWAWTHGEALSRVFLTKAYGDLGRTSPRDDDAQNDFPGLFVFLCKNLHANSTALGMYLGQREFFMVTVGDGTVTFAHEMGHAVYLRHSLIRFDSSKKVTTDISNSNWLDHDQGDAIVCVMSYENDFFGSDGATKRSSKPVEWHFCGVCALTLRHYDRVNMSANSLYRSLIYKEFLPIKLADNTFAPLGGKKPSIKKNKSIDLKALARAEPTINNSGGPFQKDLTSMKGGKWVSDAPSRADFTSFVRKVSGRNVTFQGRLQGKNAGTGTVRVHFEIDGHKSETVEVSVTN